jgi:hypothetical protein
MDEVIEFYNEQIFKSVHKITKLNCQMQARGTKEVNRFAEEVQEGEAEIKNMFFLI